MKITFFEPTTRTSANSPLSRFVDGIEVDFVPFKNSEQQSRDVALLNRSGLTATINRCDTSLYPMKCLLRGIQNRNIVWHKEQFRIGATLDFIPRVQNGHLELCTSSATLRQ